MCISMNFKYMRISMTHLRRKVFKGYFFIFNAASNISNELSAIFIDDKKNTFSTIILNYSWICVED